MTIINNDFVLNPSGNVRAVWLDTAADLWSCRSDDLWATQTNVDLGITTATPSMLIQPSGRILMASRETSPRTGLTLRASNDDGMSYPFLSYPGAGYYPKLWQDTQNPSCPLLCFAHESANAGGVLGVYRSWDGGATWDSRVDIPPVGSQQPGVCSVGSRILLAWGLSLNFMVSDDFGASWVSKSHTTTNPVGVESSPKLWKDATDPSSPLLCFVVDATMGVGYTFRYVSYDGGATWDNTGWGPYNSELAYCGTGQVLWRAQSPISPAQPLLSSSTDYGETWA